MKFLMASALAALVAAPAAAAVTVTYEAPGVQNSSIVLDWGGIETFNGRAAGSNQTFTTDFGTGASPIVITGTYTNVDIRARDLFGGANGVGRYAEVDGSPYTIDFTTSNGKKLNYFGFWLSALDKGNQVSFFDGATEVFKLTPADVRAFTGACPSSAYCGNPNDAFTGRNTREPYVFVNVQFSRLGGGASGFDRIVWSENPDVGDYETDNHTVGYIAAIPEPATWAMMIAGFGLVGFAARRRREGGVRALA